MARHKGASVVVLRAYLRNLSIRPLKCPCCGGEMRTHKADQIRLHNLNAWPWESITLIKASTPRAPHRTAKWTLDCHDGTASYFEPETTATWMPTAPRYKRERPEP